MSKDLRCNEDLCDEKLCNALNRDALNRDDPNRGGTSHRHTSSPHDVGAIRLPELAVGLFIVAASIGGALMWQRSVESGTAILVAARDMSRGDIVSEGDLTRVVLTTTGEIALIRASALEQVVGRRITANIARGTPLSPALLATAGTIGLLDGLVGFTVSVSSAPVDLAAGDAVRVFTVRSTFEGETVVEEVPGPIEIWTVSNPDPTSSDRAVTVKTPLESISRIVGNEDIHLVKVVR